MNPGLFGPDWIASWVSGLTLLILAVCLYGLDVANPAQRLFALLLTMRGLTFFLGPLRFEAATADGSVLWANLAPYAIIPLVPLVVAFLSLYPRRRGLARLPGGLWSLLALTMALETWYFVDHNAYAEVTHELRASYARHGPLFVLTGLRLPMFALAGLILAGDYLRAPKGSLGFSLFLMVAAFTLNGLFDGMLAVLDLASDLRDPATVWWPWAWSASWLPALALPISLLTLARLLPVLRAARDDPEMQEIVRFFAIGAPLALVSAWTIQLPTANAQDIATFLLAVWRLLIPLLLAYALLRHQLFNIDVHLKAGVRRAIVLGAFTVTFFVVAEAGQSLLQGDRGPAFGIAAAGVLSLASRPVHSFASRVSDKFMPDTKPIAQQSYGERLRFYLEQWRLIRHDGEVTAKERQMLDRLRDTLALPDDAVHRIEATGELPPDAEARPRVDAPAEVATKDSRLELAVRATLATGAMALVFGMLSQGIVTVIPLSSQAAGLIAAAVVSLLLGPLEHLADRLTHRIAPTVGTDARDLAARRQAFADALAVAFQDGSLSRRDLDYLASLQERLRISAALRWQLERRARRAAPRAAAA